MEEARSSTTSSMASNGGGEQPLQLLLPSSFPELVGLSGEDAKTKLRHEYPILSLSTIQVIPDNSIVTMDYREDRVRIFVDEKTGKVVNAPRIG